MQHKGPGPLKRSQVYWTTSLEWALTLCMRPTQNTFSTPFGSCSLNCKYSMAAGIFSLVREKLTECKAKSLPQLLLSPEFWVTARHLLISQRSLLSFPITAGSFLAAFMFVLPTRQSRQGPDRFVAKRPFVKLCKSRDFCKIAEKAKEHATSSIQQGHTLLTTLRFSLFHVFFFSFFPVIAHGMTKWFLVPLS